MIDNYTIPRTVRELQQSYLRTLTQKIIPYQELLGNYNSCPLDGHCEFIIPYQELLGNYNAKDARKWICAIIPYQELLGNYNRA